MRAYSSAAVEHRRKRGLIFAVSFAEMALYSVLLQNRRQQRWGLPEDFMARPPPIGSHEWGIIIMPEWGIIIMPEWGIIITPEWGIIITLE